MTSIFFFLWLARIIAPRAELIKKTGTEKLQSGKKVLNVRQGEDDTPTGARDAAQFANEGEGIKGMLDAFHTDHSVKFPVSEWQWFIHVRKNKVRLLLINVGTDSIVAAVAQSRGEKAIAGWNVEDSLMARPGFKQTEDDSHVPGEIADMCEFPLHDTIRH